MATNRGAVESNIVYNLADGTEIRPVSQGRLKLRLTLHGQLYSLGTLPFHFMPGHTNWNQVLVGRPALKNFNLLPEQNIPQNLNKINNNSNQSSTNQSKQSTE